MVRIIAFIITSVLTLVFAAAFVAETVLLFMEFGLKLGLTMATFAPQQYIFFPSLGLLGLYFFRPVGQVALEAAMSRVMPALGGLIVIGVTLGGTYVLLEQFRGSGSDRSWWEVSRAALEAEHELELDRARVRAADEAAARWRADEGRDPILQDTYFRADQALRRGRELQDEIAAAEAAGDNRELKLLMEEKERLDSVTPSVRSIIAAHTRMGSVVREDMDLSEHVDLEVASTALIDYRGLARLLPDVQAYCIVTGSLEAVAYCREQQGALRDRITALHATDASKLAARHPNFLALKTAFLFYVFGLGIFVLTNHRHVENVTGVRAKTASKALVVGALALLFWPILNQAYVMSMRAMFGLDQSGSFVELAPLYVAFAIVWTAAIVLFFLRINRAGAATWTQVGTLSLTVLTVLQFDVIVHQINRFIGAGAEPAYLISAVALLVFLGWQARILIREASVFDTADAAAASGAAPAKSDAPA